MPSRKTATKDTEYCSSISPEVRKMFEDAIMEEYAKVEENTVTEVEE